MIGRSPSADLHLEEDGIWDEHARLTLDPAEGFVLETTPHALATVNGETLARAILRNGDVIDLGSAKMQFGLSETRQKGLRFREVLTWAAITLITFGQLTLIYWLVR